MPAAKSVHPYPKANRLDYEIHEGESKAVVQKLRHQHGSVVALSFHTPDEAAVHDTVALFKQVVAIRSQLLTARREQKVEALIKALVPDPPLSETKLIQATMKSDAMKQVVRSRDLIKALDVSRLAGLSRQNPSAQPNRWKKSGQIFALSFNGIDYYPLYALDPASNYRPYPAVAEIISVLNNKDAWGLAFWFASANGYLDGKRPQDLLASKPAMVVDAARHQIIGMQHG